jgi:hypothetical protein
MRNGRWCESAPTIGLMAPPEAFKAPEFIASKLALNAPAAGTHSIVAFTLASSRSSRRSRLAYAKMPSLP